jgi:hypothetical protein
MLASLHSDESGIYGRFGCREATTNRSCTVNRRLARFREEAPRGGEIELLDFDAARHRVPGIYVELDRRPGSVTRPPYWWLAAAGAAGAGLGSASGRWSPPCITALTARASTATASSHWSHGSAGYP